MFNYIKNKNKTQQTGSRESVDSSETFASKDGKEITGKILHLKIHFKVSFLGQINDVTTIHSKNRDSEAQLIDRIEEAQIEGLLPLGTKELDEVNIHISRYGVKVLDIHGQDVLQRHPLHTIGQLIQYDDGCGKQNIAMKIQQVGKTVCQCFIFQCQSEDQATSICLCVKKIFDAISQI